MRHTPNQLIEGDIFSLAFQHITFGLRQLLLKFVRHHEAGAPTDEICCRPDHLNYLLRSGGGGGESNFAPDTSMQSLLQDLFLFRGRFSREP